MLKVLEQKCEKCCEVQEITSHQVDSPTAEVLNKH